MAEWGSRGAMPTHGASPQHTPANAKAPPPTGTPRPGHTVTLPRYQYPTLAASLPLSSMGIKECAQDPGRGRPPIRGPVVHRSGQLSACLLCLWKIRSAHDRGPKPTTPGHQAVIDHLPARTIARMPTFVASGSTCQASITSCKSVLIGPSAGLTAAPGAAQSRKCVCFSGFSGVAD